MKIIEPSVEYWKQENSIEHVCRAAQISYQSEPKKGEAAEKFYEALKNRGHWSVFRHESYYYKVSYNEGIINAEILKQWDYSPYIQYVTKLTIGTRGVNVFIVTNGNYLLDNPSIKEYLEPYKVTPEEFKEECPELMRYTFCLTTQISTTRELLRHSPQSCTELSTRYIKIGGKVEPSIVRPWWLLDNLEGSDKVKRNIYLRSCENSFEDYENLLACNMKAQDARGVLPLDTMSKIVMTHSVKEWRKIIDMRYYGTTGVPHPNIKIITGMVKNKLEELGYEFEN